jgi:hypothetical protein
MAKIQHLYSTTPGNVPGSLVRGQVAINIPDKIVYANDPFGNVAPISNGNPGVANAGSLVGSHIPVQFHPVAQFGVGMTEAQLTALFTDNGTTATLQPVKVFALGRVWYTPVLTCPHVSAGAYQLNLNASARTVSISGLTLPHTGSGSVNVSTSSCNLVFYSDSHIYPWFYLPESYGAANSAATLYRISPYQTFGAIPVSTGFAGANAATYWGHYP